METIPKCHPILGNTKLSLPAEVSQEQVLIDDWLNESPLNKLPPAQQLNDINKTLGRMEAIQSSSSERLTKLEEKVSALKTKVDKATWVTIGAVGVIAAIATTAISLVKYLA